MDGEYSEEVAEKYQDIIQSLYDLQNEINDDIQFAEEDEDAEDVKQLQMYRSRVEKMLECII